MHPDFYQLLELAMGLAVLCGICVGLKVLVVDRLPSRRSQKEMRQRFTELEERYEALLDLQERQMAQLEEQAERLDFNERLLARDRGTRTPSPESPGPATPA